MAPFTIRGTSCLGRLLPRDYAGTAWWLLLLHLVLSPLVFCTDTAEAFEENKAALLTATALALTGLGLSRRLASPSPAAPDRRRREGHPALALRALA